MSDKYLASNNGVGVYDIWEHDENGQRVQRIGTVKADTQDSFEGMLKVVSEMNRLERLITDSVNSAHLTDRTHVQHAFLKQNMDGQLVRSMQEVPDDSERDYHFMTVRKDHWNRMVRVLKELAERFLLP